MPPPGQLHLIDGDARDRYVTPLPTVSQLLADRDSFEGLDQGYVLVELSVGDCRLHVELIEAVEDDSRWPRVRTVDPSHQDHVDNFLGVRDQDKPQLLTWAGRTWVVFTDPWSR